MLRCWGSVNIEPRWNRTDIGVESCEPNWKSWNRNKESRRICLNIWSREVTNVRAKNQVRQVRFTAKLRYHWNKMLSNYIEFCWLMWPETDLGRFGFNTEPQISNWLFCVFFLGFASRIRANINENDFLGGCSFHDWGEGMRCNIHVFDDYRNRTMHQRIPTWIRASQHEHCTETASQHDHCAQTASPYDRCA